MIKKKNLKSSQFQKIDKVTVKQLEENIVIRVEYNFIIFINNVLHPGNDLKTGQSITVVTEQNY